MTVEWYDIAPADAVDLDLSKRVDITAPLNEMGERCPWPWEPQQLGGAPMGQYHCGYCGAMVMAGIRHLDYAEVHGTCGRCGGMTTPANDPSPALCAMCTFRTGPEAKP